MHLRSAAGRALSKTARNSQVLCCFRRRMPIENPASLRRTTDTWLIFCCKKQQKQRPIAGTPGVVPNRARDMQLSGRLSRREIMVCDCGDFRVRFAAGRRDPQRAGNATSMPPVPRGRCPRAKRAWSSAGLAMSKRVEESPGPARTRARFQNSSCGLRHVNHP